jgi:hypothetical protein
MDRRTFVLGAAATAAALSTPQLSTAASSDLDPVFKEVEKRHDEAVQRLQTWIRQPSIAAENREVDKGCELTMQMLRDAGFQSVNKVPTDGQPGIFATLDAGAPKTLGVYFMYDVKQVNPAEWSSPPWDAALVDKPGVGKVVVGRGAVNQKGPEATFLAAIHAIRGAGRKMPVNLVLVAEGEEEIGSPHFPQIVRRPEVIAALKNSEGIFLPDAAQDLDGSIIVELGAKGVVELELVSSGEKWGRGPAADLHSSEKASGPCAQHTGVWRWKYSSDSRICRQSTAALRNREVNDYRGVETPRRSDRDEADGRQALDWRCRLAGVARTTDVAADREHRRTGRRLYRNGR